MKFAGVANSTWYSQKNKVCSDGRRKNKGRPFPGYSLDCNGDIIPDELIAEALKGYRDRKEFINGGGCKKLSAYLLRDYNYRVNHKKVYRLCKENKLLLPGKKKRQKNRHKKISQNRIITEPLQMWELDLKYGYIHGEKRFFFVMAIIDVCMRFIVDYYVGLRCTGKDLAFTLSCALKKFDIPEKNQLVIRSDNGPQMTSKVFMNHIEDLGEKQILHELIPVRTPNKNAHIEAFNSILEIEFFHPRYFNSYGQAYKEVVDFINFYNYRRVHSSLGMKTPMEVYNSYKMKEELKISPVKV